MSLDGDKNRRSSLDVMKEWFRNKGSSTANYDLDLGRKTTWVDAYVGRIAKPANAYLRWNLVFTMIIIIMLTSPIWLSFIPVVGKASLEICLVICIILPLLWFIGAVNAIRYCSRLIKYKNRTSNYDIDTEKKPSINSKHLVGICLYKEPIQLMIDTIESIAIQSKANEKISVVVGMEERTPDRIEKEKELRKKFDKRFERFMVTIHPKGLEGDITGKCSNINYSMRNAVKMLRDDKAYALDQFDAQLLVTTGDCDSIFGDGYFEALEEDFLRTPEKNRQHTVWQSPLFYAINLHNSPFFVRVTGLLRAFFMMAYLIPWNINTMSIFSLTLELYEAGEYTHPGYQMEDIIALIRWSLAIRCQCTIRGIPVATLSGPTSGTNYVNEWYEWARQIRRWTIGAAEVFHYFAVKSCRLPILSALGFSIKFIFYYGFLLCIGQIYGLIGPILTPIMMNVSNAGDGLLISSHLFAYITSCLLGLTYLEMAIIFMINKIAEQTFPGGRRDNTPLWRSFFHWIGSVPTILMYCGVELFAFIEVSIRGKSVCSHSASKKDQLVNKKSPNDIGKVYPI